MKKNVTNDLVRGVGRPGGHTHERNDSNVSLAWSLERRWSSWTTWTSPPLALCSKSLYPSAANVSLAPNCCERKFDQAYTRTNKTPECAPRRVVRASGCGWRSDGRSYSVSLR